MNLEDLARQIQKQEDIEAIKQLKGRYCLRVDTHDWDGVAELFTEDAVWDGKGVGRYEGREAIRLFFHNLPQMLSFALHYVMNPIITVNGDSATGSWYLLEPCTMVAGNQAVWGTARYEEEYVRVGGTWKFKTVRLLPVFWTPFEQGWVKKRSVLE
jgi:ketosteroid isomerase-like protein